MPLADRADITPAMTDPRLHAPATLRNRDPILAVLRRILPLSGTVLEVNSGTGEHAAYMAPRLAPRRWQPSEIDERACASITAYAADTHCENLLPPLELDVTRPVWPVRNAMAVVSINLIHIAPWHVCLGLLDGAARLLPQGGILYFYGPFKRGGTHTAPSNEAFDRSLRSENPEWGIRDLDDVAAEARNRGFELAEIVNMPANNLSMVFRKTESSGSRD